MLAHVEPLLRYGLLVMAAAAALLWLLAVIVVSLLVGTVHGLVLMPLARGRWPLLVLMPAINITLYLLLDPGQIITARFELPSLLLTLTALPVTAACGLLQGLIFVVLFGPRQQRPATPVAADWIQPPLFDSGSRPLLAGITAPVEGLRYLIAHPGLWRYALMPVAISAVITLFVLIAMILGAIAFAVYLHPKFPATWWGLAMEVVAVVGLGVLAVGLALATWLVLESVLGDHFRGRLAQQVELRLGLAPDQAPSVRLQHRLLDALNDLRRLAAINGGLLLLHLLPGIGSVMALVLGLYFNASIFGQSYMNLPMDLRGMRRQQRLELLREHRWETVGLGGAVLLSGFVPFIGSLLLATAAVGAVLTYRGWQPVAATRELPGTAAALG